MASHVAPEGERRDTFAALRVRDFRVLIIGRMIAQVGEQSVTVAVSWELYKRTNDPLALGLVGLAQIIPVLLLSLPGGYVADRYNRKWVTLISQVVLIVCAVLLAIISITEGSLPVLYGLLAVIGAARAFNNPAEGALTPQLVPKALYFNAMTWNSSVWQTSAIIGPAIGAGIMAITGHAYSVYLFNAAAGAILVTALLMIKTPPVMYNPNEEKPIDAVRNGWRFVRKTPVVLAAIALDMFAVLLGGATALLPIFASDILFSDVTGLGILRAAPSVGALLMATYLARRPPFQRAGKTLLLAVAGFGVATIFFGVSTSFLLSLAMLALLGALDNISVVIRHTLILTYTPDELRGRVGAVNTVFIGASNELGAFESGVAARFLGPVGAVIFGGIGTLVVVGVTAYLVPQLRNMRKIGDDLPPPPLVSGENDPALAMVEDKPALT
jgi:MFS family permease